jgi:GTP-binding protein
MNSPSSTSMAASTAHVPGHALVAIVGRPNVGKSSLFNSLVGRRAAIVSEVAGTTRDRISTQVNHGGRALLVVDTGGLVADPETSMDTLVGWQVGLAVAEADVVILVTDVTQGATLGDQHVAQQLRRSRKPVVLAANKVDSKAQEPLVPELYQLNLGDPIPISAYHRLGIDDLLDAVLVQLPPERETPEESSVVPRLAIVGRPNVGKSALTNAVLGMERSIVSEVPGTTRDALDTSMEMDGRPIVLTDTAGIRRRGAVQPGIERYSVLRALRAIDRSDVAILVLDATELVTAQDLHIAGQVMESFKGAVVAINKWDLIPEESRNEDGGRRAVLRRLRFIDHVPVCFISAITGEGVAEVMTTALNVYDQWQQWVHPRKLQSTVMDAVAEHLPPKHGRSALKVYRVKQESVGPPTFVFQCNNPTLMHFSYERYLENVLRREFGFQGCHLRLEFRGRGKLHIIGGHRAGGRLH